MKLFRIFTLLFVVASLFTLSSCGSDDDVTLTPTPDPLDIVETAQATDNLSTLVEAVIQADLVDALKGDGPLTVFAPTNDAFQDLLDSEPSWNSLTDIDNNVLKSVLLYHVVEAEAKAASLTDSYVATLNTGPNDEAVVLQIDVTGGVKFNGSAEPITTDVEASNGVVHIIDKVMLPPTVVNHALNNPVFSSLVAALTRADLTTDYVSVLSGTGPFTVFAPTNAAFQALLDSNMNWNSLDDIPLATLEAVLNYHVVSGANVQSSELTDDQMITTLGGTVTTDLSDGPKLETSSGQSLTIINTNVQGTNGVVHVIDMVMLP